MSVTLDDDDDQTPGLGADGRPDPAYAASLGMIPAPFGRRSVAFAIDAAAFLFLLLPIFIGSIPRWLDLIAEVPDVSRWMARPEFIASLIWYAVGQGLVTILTVVQLILHGVRGVTIGKAAMGIRSVNVATFGKPGGRVVLRALVFSAAFTVVPYIGAIPFLLSPLWDSEQRGRGWLDRIGRNWLIDVRQGLDPFDTKALRHARRALTAPAVAEARELPSLATGAAMGALAFVPSARSSSGVVSPALDGEAASDWQPPEFGAPAVDAASAQPPAPVAPAPPLAPAPPAAAPTAAAPAPAAPAPVQRQTSAELVFSDGLTLAVNGAGLIGRNPEPRPGEVVEHLYRIDDDARQLSKTHLAFGIDEAGVWVADRGSSNGTFVTTDSGAVLELEPMKKTHVAAGSIVEIGDKTFTVRNAT